MPLASILQCTRATADLRTRTLTTLSIGRANQVFQGLRQLIGRHCTLPHQSGILSIELDEIGQVAQLLRNPNNIGHKLIGICE
jgi:hypothetical protein